MQDNTLTALRVNVPSPSNSRVRFALRNYNRLCPCGFGFLSQGKLGSLSKSFAQNDCNYSDASRVLRI